MKNRVAQVLYALGVIGALNTAVVLAQHVWANWEFLKRNWAYPGVLDDYYAAAAIMVGIYGAGWALRWIISGVTTTPLSYLKRG